MSRNTLNILKLWKVQQAVSGKSIGDVELLGEVGLTTTQLNYSALGRLEDGMPYAACNLYSTLLHLVKADWLPSTLKGFDLKKPDRRNSEGVVLGFR